MKRFEFTISVILNGYSESDARDKLDDVLMQRRGLWDTEEHDIADVILNSQSWDCEEYDD